MDENHQDTANNHLTTTEDVEWVLRALRGRVDLC
jgi:hypothetical protein